MVKINKSMAAESSSTSVNRTASDTPSPPKLMENQHHPSSGGNPVASLAQSGICFGGTQATSCTSSSDLWIVDSGASDHMTSISSLFHTYSPCSGLEKVRIADGSLSPIAGKGSIKLSNGLTLHSVLHVPKLTCNLLSVSKLSNHSQCRVIFHSTYCEFQEQSSGRMIGSAKQWNGLYCFIDNTSSGRKACGLSGVSSSPAVDQIMLWHRRLGHPSLRYMQHLFPELVQKSSVRNIECESCEFSKSHRSPYLSREYSPSAIFSYT